MLSQNGGERMAMSVTWTLMVTASLVCGVASDELCRLVVLNTASIQLLPTTVAAVRSAHGCTAPLDILPAVWLSSVLSVAAGLLAARLLQRLWRA